MYAVGIVDGMIASPLFGASDSGKAEKLAKCIDDVSGGQVEAWLTEYIDAHPDRISYQMNALAYFALQEECGLLEAP